MEDAQNLQQQALMSTTYLPDEKMVQEGLLQAGKMLLKTKIGWPKRREINSKGQKEKGKALKKAFPF